MKEFADDSFKFDKIGRKLSKWVEYTVEKGEIARNKHFKQLVLQTHKNWSLFGKGLKSFVIMLNS